MKIQKTTYALLRTIPTMESGLPVLFAGSFFICVRETMPSTIPTTDVTNPMLQHQPNVMLKIPRIRDAMAKPCFCPVCIRTGGGGGGCHAGITGCGGL